MVQFIDIFCLSNIDMTDIWATETIAMKQMLLILKVFEILIVTFFRSVLFSAV